MRISATPMRKYAYQGGTFILYRFELSKITHFNIWPNILVERQMACYWRWYLYQRTVGYYLKPQMPFYVQVCFVFTAVFVYRVVFTVCKSQRFLFCLSPYLFSEWHIVPQLYIHIKQSRVHSRKALAECKASRRLGKQIRGLSLFLSKAHPTTPYIAFPEKRPFCFAFCRGKICKIQLFDITLPHH